MLLTDHNDNPCFIDPTQVVGVTEHELPRMTNKGGFVSVRAVSVAGGHTFYVKEKLQEILDKALAESSELLG